MGTGKVTKRPTTTRKKTSTTRAQPSRTNRSSGSRPTSRAQGRSAGRTGSGTGTAGRSGNTERTGSSGRLNPQDRNDVQTRSQQSETRGQESAAKVNELSQRVQENLGPQEHPQSSLFRDPQRAQNIEQAQTELQQAKEGNHQELQDLRSQQEQQRSDALQPAREKAEQTQADLRVAEQNLEQIRQENERDQQTQATDHAQAERDRRETRTELSDIRKPGEPSAATMVDKIDGYDDTIQGYRERNEAFQQDSKRQANQQSSAIQDRYGEQFEKNPQLKKDYDRFLAIDKELRNENLSTTDKARLRDERNGLARKMSEVKDSSGEHRLSSDAYKLDSIQRKARDYQESTEKAIERAEKSRKETAQKANQLYRNEPGIGEKIDSYREAKKRSAATTPEAVTERNERRLSDAQEQLSQAREAKTRAEGELKEQSEEYDKANSSKDRQALADKQKELVSGLEEQVKDLTNIRQFELSDGLRHAGIDTGQMSDIKFDGDKLTYKKDGLDMVATVGPDGKLSIEGRSSDPNNSSSYSSTRSKNEEGHWQTDKLSSVKEDKRATRKRDFERFADGSSKDVQDYRAKNSDNFSHSETVKGADGSSYSSRTRRDDYATTTTSNRTSAPYPEHDGGQDSESHYHRVTRDGSYTSTSHTIKSADGSEVTNAEDYHDYSYTQEKNVEGASWLWKHSPQNLRNSIGDNAQYGKVIRTSTVKSPDGKETTNKSEMERWTSADGNRTLEAQRGQKGLPDTWTYTTKKGDDVHSQTFIKGTEDTSISHEYTDRDGFRVKETTEDFRETAQQIKEQTNVDSPESGHTEIRTKEEATLADIQRLAKDNPELAAFMKTPDFKRFMDAIGDDKFNLALRESEQTLTNGREREDFQLTAQGADGHSLVIMGNGEGGGMRYVEPGEEGYKGLTMLDGSGHRMQLNNDGQMQVFDANGVQKVVKDLEKIGGAPGKVPQFIRGMKTEIPADLGKLKMFQKMGFFQGGAKEMGAFTRAMKEYDGAFSSTFGKTVDLLGVGLSSFDTYNQASEGNWGNAFSSTASGLRDVGSLAANTGQGFRAGSYVRMVNGAEKAAKPWEAGAILKNTSRIGQLGKALGVAGAVYQAGEGIYDMTQGRYLRGGLGMAAAGGAALAIWGGASWAGPVGWGVAALATAGIYTVDYVNANAIAEPEIPLY